MFIKKPNLDQYTAASKSVKNILDKGVNIDYSH